MVLQISVTLVLQKNFMKSRIDSLISGKVAVFYALFPHINTALHRCYPGQLLTYIMLLATAQYIARKSPIFLFPTSVVA